MASRFWVGNDGTWDASDTTHWAASSGGAGGQSVPGSGDTVTIDNASGTGTITVNTNFNVTSVTCGAMAMTLDFSANNNSPTLVSFSGTGTGVRTINLGSGTFSLTGNNANVWDTGTATNLTLSASSATLNFTYSGSVGTRTMSAGSSPTFGTVKVSAGTDTWDCSNNFTVLTSFDFTGFTGTKTDKNTNVSGNLTFGTGMTCTSGATGFNFNTSSTATFRTNGVQVNVPITISKSGGTLTMLDALDMGGASARTLTFTQGTFNAAGFNVTCAIFSSSNSNTRTLTMGSGTWFITGNATTVWNTSTSTNLNAYTGNVNFSYSGGTGTRTIQWGASPTWINFVVSAGSDTVNQSSNLVATGKVDFTGFTGTWTGGTITALSGNLIMGTGMTCSVTGNAITLSGTSGTQTITSNSVSINRPLILNGAGGTFSLADNFATDSTHSVTLTNGTFNTGGFTATSGSFALGSGTKTLTLGTTIWTVSSTGSVWNTNTNSTGFTLNAGTSTIKINDASSSSKTFAPGAMTYYNLLLSGAGIGTFIIGTTTATTTFNKITVDTPPHTVQVFAGKTLNVTSLTWSGTAANPNIFQSTTNGTAWNLISPTTTTQSENYISLQDSHASGGAFYAGNASTNVSNNTGWIFQLSPQTKQSAGRDGNDRPTIICASSVDGTAIVRVTANSSTHGLSVLDGTGQANNGNNSGNAAVDGNSVPVWLAFASDNSGDLVEVYANQETGAILIETT